MSLAGIYMSRAAGSLHAANGAAEGFYGAQGRRRAELCRARQGWEAPAAMTMMIMMTTWCCDDLGFKVPAIKTATWLAVLTLR
jgi:hypothetical protein